MFSLLKLIFKTCVIYISLIVSVRILGKRQIGELEVSEFITTLIISEIAAIPIAEKDMSIRNALIPLVIILILELIITFLTEKFRPLRKIIDGTPIILISKGQILYKNMKKARITMDELLTSLRIQQFSDVSAIYYAILEANGKISAFEKATPPAEEKGIAHALVLDGSLNASELQNANTTEKEVMKRIEACGYKLRDILLLTIDDSGACYIVPKK